MSTGEPAGEGGGGGGGQSTPEGDHSTGTPVGPTGSAFGSQSGTQHPPPSPLSGCYLLVVLPEPHTAQHKDLIVNRLGKGFLSWDKDSCHVDLEKELQAIVTQAPEGEEARNGERLIQYATENLVTEVLIHPQSNTLLQCIRNLLASFTKHRHIIHAGYTFSGNGSWILQDGTFSLADFLDAFSEHEVQRVLRAYENSVTVDIHCASVGDWTTQRLSKENCTRSCRVRVNPDDVLTAGVPAIASFTNYIGQYLVSQTLDQLMEPSDVVGNIRFSHPTLYVFPGGQGDAALFGINGFNMLVDGGFARKACFWDFARHLDRLDAVLLTRINNSNIGGMSSVLRKKQEMHVYPQIGHFFCNLVERRQANSPDGDKDVDPLILNLTDLGQEMMVNLRHINLRAHPCYRDLEPINLYHKVGHGTLDMYILSPSKDTREVREFLAKWHASDSKLFASGYKKDPSSVVFPIQNLVSICALLVWLPANPEDTITRILFPGSTPQSKIFEGLERLKHLEFIKRPVCTASSLSPSTSLTALKEKSNKQKASLFEKSIDKEKDIKKVYDQKREKKDPIELKSAKGLDESGKPAVTSTPVIPMKQSAKVDVKELKTKKVAENKKIERETRVESKKIEKDMKTETKKVEKEVKEIKEVVKKEAKRDVVSKVDKHEVETKKTDIIKTETEKTVITKESKAKPERKKKEVKETKPVVKAKPEPVPKAAPKIVDKKPKPTIEKKDVKSSPTTPKKLATGNVSRAEISKGSAKLVQKTSTTTSITTKTPTSVMPAKSAKDATNRKVVESKNIAMSSTTSTVSSASVAKTASITAKPKATERKPISRRPKTGSPSKARVPGSPAKSTRSTPTASVKSEKDGVIRKSRVDKAATDSSAVSTPSAMDAESVAKLIDKSLTEKSDDLSIDSIESKVLADLKEEREVVEEIEAVLCKAERNQTVRKEDQLEGDDEITAEATDRKEDATEDDVTAEIEDAPKKLGSRKESQEFTEEDEYLIVEKEEIFTEDSVQSGEGEQKHLLDEVESEKVKKLYELSKELDPREEDKSKEIDEAEEKDKDEQPEKTINVRRETEQVDSSPENREDLGAETREVVSSTVISEAPQKSEDSGKKDSEEATKEASCPSKGRLDYSEKKSTDTDLKPEPEQKDLIPEKREESQDRISTLESGATTTAPTLPEDERIPLDEIKEVADEKHFVDEVKKRGFETAKVKQPEIPQPTPSATIKSFVIRETVPTMQRDIVKTPDEVADLPVHEEVDPKLYAMDEFDKVKEDKVPEMKEPPTPPVKEQKGVFSFFGKVADKFEKGIDKLTGKSKKDGDRDSDEKSSKSSSPKELKPHEESVRGIGVAETDMEKVFAKVGKIEHHDTFEKAKPQSSVDVKVAAIKDTASFLQQEIGQAQLEPVIQRVQTEPVLSATREAELENVFGKMTDIPQDVGSEIDEPLQKKIFDGPKLQDDFPKADTDAIEDTKEVEALLEEASKKFVTVKDSLRDSLESLEEKIEAEILSKEQAEPEKDSVKNTLTGVAEKLEEMIPRFDDSVPETKVREKVKFEIEKDSDEVEEFSEEYAGPFRNVKEAVRDVGEVLAGTAGIEIDEKPKDVIEIVKKVAEVLKDDDFLSEKILFDSKEESLVNKKSAQSSAPELGDEPESKVIGEVVIIPKKVGITEELPPQEEIQEMLEGGIARPLPVYETPAGIEIVEEPCVKVVKEKIDITSPMKEDVSLGKDVKDLCEDLLNGGPPCRVESEKDTIFSPKESSSPQDEKRVDVMDAGIEEVCVKKEAKRDLREDEEEEGGEKDVEEPEISFEQKLSPAQAEIVMVTPDSAPTSPKFSGEKSGEKDLVTGVKDEPKPSEVPSEIKEFISSKADVYDIIEEVIKQGRKLTIEIIEYIVIVKKVSREHVIYIIEEIIINKGIPPESVVENIELLKGQESREDLISLTKRIEIEEYIVTEYIAKGKRITVQVVEEIAVKKVVPKRIIIEIIEEIIIKRKISRESVYEMIEEDFIKQVKPIYDEYDAQPEAPISDEVARLTDQKLGAKSLTEQKHDAKAMESQIPSENQCEPDLEEELSPSEASKEKTTEIFNEKDLDEGKSMDDFVNIPSKEAVMSFLSEERRSSDEDKFTASRVDVTSAKQDISREMIDDAIEYSSDNFEAVEQEYKVDVTPTTSTSLDALSKPAEYAIHEKEGAMEAIEVDIDEVVDAAEKFTNETKEKLLKLEKSVEITKQNQETLADHKVIEQSPAKVVGRVFEETVPEVPSMSTSKSEQADTTEKYLIEDREKKIEDEDDVLKSPEDGKEMTDVVKDEIDDAMKDIKDKLPTMEAIPTIEDANKKTDHVIEKVEEQIKLITDEVSPNLESVDKLPSPAKENLVRADVDATPDFQKVDVINEKVEGKTDQISEQVTIAKEMEKTVDSEEKNFDSETTDETMKLSGTESTALTHEIHELKMDAKSVTEMMTEKTEKPESKNVPADQSGVITPKESDIVDKKKLDSKMTDEKTETPSDKSLKEPRDDESCEQTDAIDRKKRSISDDKSLPSEPDSKEINEAMKNIGGEASPSIEKMETITTEDSAKSVKVGPTETEELDDDDQIEERGTVRRMVVTASSEDGGHETELCPTGSITFTKSVTPEDSLKDISAKSEPDRDSLQMEKDSSISGKTTPEKDSIDDKSVSDLKEDKITPEDSLEKSLTEAAPSSPIVTDHAVTDTAEVVEPIIETTGHPSQVPDDKKIAEPDVKNDLKKPSDLSELKSTDPVFPAQISPVETITHQPDQKIDDPVEIVENQKREDKSNQPIDYAKMTGIPAEPIGSAPHDDDSTQEDKTPYPSADMATEKYKSGSIISDSNCGITDKMATETLDFGIPSENTQDMVSDPGKIGETSPITDNTSPLSKLPIDGVDESKDVFEDKLPEIAPSLHDGAVTNKVSDSFATAIINSTEKTPKDRLPSPHCSEAPISLLKDVNETDTLIHEPHEDVDDMKHKSASPSVEHIPIASTTPSLISSEKPVDLGVSDGKHTEDESPSPISDKTAGKSRTPSLTSDKILRGTYVPDAALPKDKSPSPTLPKTPDKSRTSSTSSEKMGAEHIPEFELPEGIPTDKPDTVDVSEAKILSPSPTTEKPLEGTKSPSPSFLHVDDEESADRRPAPSSPVEHVLADASSVVDEKSSSEKIPDAMVTKASSPLDNLAEKSTPPSPIAEKLHELKLPDEIEPRDRSPSPPASTVTDKPDSLNITPEKLDDETTSGVVDDAKVVDDKSSPKTTSPLDKLKEKSSVTPEKLDEKKTHDDEKPELGSSSPAGDKPELGSSFPAGDKPELGSSSAAGDKSSDTGKSPGTIGVQMDVTEVDLPNTKTSIDAVEQISTSPSFISEKLDDKAPEDKSPSPLMDAREVKSRTPSITADKIDAKDILDEKRDSLSEDEPKLLSSVGLQEDEPQKSDEKLPKDALSSRKFDKQVDKSRTSSISSEKSDTDDIPDVKLELLSSVGLQEDEPQKSDEKLPKNALSSLKFDKQVDKSRTSSISSEKSDIDDIPDVNAPKDGSTDKSTDESRSPSLVPEKLGDQQIPTVEKTTRDGSPSPVTSDSKNTFTSARIADEKLTEKDGNTQSPKDKSLSPETDKTKDESKVPSPIAADMEDHKIPDAKPIVDNLSSTDKPTEKSDSPVDETSETKSIPDAQDSEEAQILKATSKEPRSVSELPSDQQEKSDEKGSRDEPVSLLPAKLSADAVSLDDKFEKDEPITTTGTTLKARSPSPALEKSDDEEAPDIHQDENKSPSLTIDKSGTPSLAPEKLDEARKPGTQDVQKLSPEDLINDSLPSPPTHEPTDFVEQREKEKSVSPSSDKDLEKLGVFELISDKLDDQKTLDDQTKGHKSPSPTIEQIGDGKSRTSSIASDKLDNVVIPGTTKPKDAAPSLISDKITPELKSISFVEDKPSDSQASLPTLDVPTDKSRTSSTSDDGVLDHEDALESKPVKDTLVSSAVDQVADEHIGHQPAPERTDQHYILDVKDSTEEKSPSPASEKVTSKVQPSTMTLEKIDKPGTIEDIPPQTKSSSPVAEQIIDATKPASVTPGKPDELDTLVDEKTKDKSPSPEADDPVYEVSKPELIAQKLDKARDKSIEEKSSSPNLQQLPDKSRSPSITASVFSDQSVHLNDQISKHKSPSPTADEPTSKTPTATVVKSEESDVPDFKTVEHETPSPVKDQPTPVSATLETATGNLNTADISDDTLRQIEEQIIPYEEVRKERATEQGIDELTDTITDDKLPSEKALLSVEDKQPDQSVKPSAISVPEKMKDVKDDPTAEDKSESPITGVVTDETITPSITTTKLETPITSADKPTLSDEIPHQLDALDKFDAELQKQKSPVSSLDQVSQIRTEPTKVVTDKSSNDVSSVSETEIFDESLRLQPEIIEKPEVKTTSVLDKEQPLDDVPESSSFVKLIDEKQIPKSSDHKSDELVEGHSADRSVAIADKLDDKSVASAVTVDKLNIVDSLDVKKDKERSHSSMSDKSDKSEAWSVSSDKIDEKKMPTAHSDSNDKPKSPEKSDDKSSASEEEAKERSLSLSIDAPKDKSRSSSVGSQPDEPKMPIDKSKSPLTPSDKSFHDDVHVSNKDKPDDKSNVSEILESLIPDSEKPDQQSRSSSTISEEEFEYRETQIPKDLKPQDPSRPSSVMEHESTPTDTSKHGDESKSPSPVSSEPKEQIMNELTKDKPATLDVGSTISEVKAQTPSVIDSKTDHKTSPSPTAEGPSERSRSPSITTEKPESPLPIYHEPRDSSRRESITPDYKSEKSPSTMKDVTEKDVAKSIAGTFPSTEISKMEPDDLSKVDFITKDTLKGIVPSETEDDDDKLDDTETVDSKFPHDRSPSYDKTPKDRSRSHSLFDTGERTPLGRSRAASLFEDKLDDKIVLPESVSSRLNISEEIDEDKDRCDDDSAKLDVTSPSVSQRGSSESLIIQKLVQADIPLTKRMDIERYVVDEFISKNKKLTSAFIDEIVIKQGVARYIVIQIIEEIVIRRKISRESVFEISEIRRQDDERIESGEEESPLKTLDAVHKDDDADAKPEDTTNSHGSSDNLAGDHFADSVVSLAKRMEIERYIVEQYILTYKKITTRVIEEIAIKHGVTTYTVVEIIEEIIIKRHISRESVFETNENLAQEEPGSTFEKKDSASKSPDAHDAPRADHSSEPEKLDETGESFESRRSSKIRVDDEPIASEISFAKRTEIKHYVTDEFVLKNKKITYQVVDDIVFEYRVARYIVIEIIEEIIVEKKLSKESVFDATEIHVKEDAKAGAEEQLVSSQTPATHDISQKKDKAEQEAMSLDESSESLVHVDHKVSDVSLGKRMDIESYIIDEFISKNKKITSEVLEGIVIKHRVPRYIVVEIIEEVIVTRKISRESLVDISEDKLLPNEEHNIEFEIPPTTSVPVIDSPKQDSPKSESSSLEAKDVKKIDTIPTSDLKQIEVSSPHSIIDHEEEIQDFASHVIQKRSLTDEYIPADAKHAIQTSSLHHEEIDLETEPRKELKPLDSGVSDTQPLQPDTSDSKQPTAQSPESYVDDKRENLSDKEPKARVSDEAFSYSSQEHEGYSSTHESSITIDKQTVSITRLVPDVRTTTPSTEIDQVENEVVTITDAKRSDIEDYIIEEYITKNKKITREIIEQIVVKKMVPRYIILEIIEEIIVKRKLSRTLILDFVEDGTSDREDTEPADRSASSSVSDKEDVKLQTGSDDRSEIRTGKSTPEICLPKEQMIDSTGKSTPDLKSSLPSEKYLDKSGFSTPDARLYDEKSGKSTPDYKTEYESQFHKAFVGGMTEIRTTHITTLSGKSTPDIGPRHEDIAELMDSQKSGLLPTGVQHTSQVSTRESKFMSSADEVVAMIHESDMTSDSSEFEVCVKKSSEVRAQESTSSAARTLDTVSSEEITTGDSKCTITSSEITRESSQLFSKVSESSASTISTTTSKVPTSSPDSYLLTDTAILRETTTSPTATANTRSSDIDSEPDITTRIFKTETTDHDSAKPEALTKTIRHFTEGEETKPEIIMKTIRKVIESDEDEPKVITNTIRRVIETGEDDPEVVTRTIRRVIETEEVEPEVVTRTIRTVVKSEKDEPEMVTTTIRQVVESEGDEPEVVTKTIRRVIETEEDEPEVVTRTIRRVIETEEDEPEMVTKTIRRVIESEEDEPKVVTTTIRRVVESEKDEPEMVIKTIREVIASEGDEPEIVTKTIRRVIETEEDEPEVVTRTIRRVIETEEDEPEMVTKTVRRVIESEEDEPEMVIKTIREVIASQGDEPEIVTKTIKRVIETEEDEPEVVTRTIRRVIETEEDEPEIVTKTIRRAIESEEDEPKVVTTTIRRVIETEEGEPEVVTRVIRREVVVPDNEEVVTTRTIDDSGQEDSEYMDGKMRLADIQPEVVKRIISREGTPEVTETVTTRTTRTIVSQEMPSSETMTKTTATTVTSEIEKPEVVTRTLSREGTPEFSETIKRTTKTITSESGPEYVTRIISREGTPDILKTADVKRIVTTVTTITGPDGESITTKDVEESTDKLDGEDLLEKLIDASQSDRSAKPAADVKSTEERFVSETPVGLKTEEIIQRTVTTVTSTSGTSTPDVKTFVDSEKSTPEHGDPEEAMVPSKSQSTIARDQSTIDSFDKISMESRSAVTSKSTAEHPASGTLKDIIAEDKSFSNKSSSDVSLPKDTVLSQLTDRSTPESSVSPYIREAGHIQSHLSGRSTPDRKSDSKSRTATPEGFRSGEVIRTIITTTRTMSDDGEIITTTKEVTEATYEQGQTVVLTEKTNVKVEDTVPSKEIPESAVTSVIGSIKASELKRGSSPGSDAASDRDMGPISPRSDISSGHSRAATHVWGSSEERHAYSDDEPSGSPLSATSQLGHSFQKQRYELHSDRESQKFAHLPSAAMSSSFYGDMPEDPPMRSTVKTPFISGSSQKFSEPIPIHGEYSSKRFSSEEEFAGGYDFKMEPKKFVDDADLDFDLAMMDRKDRDREGFSSHHYTNGASVTYTNGTSRPEHVPPRMPDQETVEKKKIDPMSASFMEERRASDDAGPSEKDPLEGWGKPLCLPSPKPRRKYNLQQTAASSSTETLAPEDLNFDVVTDWGEPLRLPSPVPPTNEPSNKVAPGTPKKEKKQPKKVVAENNKNKKRSESPSKNDKKTKESKNKVQPVYMDLTYVPHHGNSFYSSLEFFKRIRARYYVFSGTEPSREVYDALLEAKKTWEDKNLEVTMIPTYDTDTLGYWVADNEEALAANRIDLSPSASRCTINLQDHETSCSAYRLEF